MAGVDSVRWALPLLTVISALVVFLRLFCKKTRGTPIRQDNYTVVAAWFFLLAGCILAVVATTRGYGQRLADFRSDPTGAVRLVAPSVFLSVTAAALGKTSIAMTLLQILRERHQRLIVWFFVASANAVIWGFAIFLWVIIWEERLVEICIARGGAWGLAVFGAIWSALTDFAFAVLPWFMIPKLARSQKEMIVLGVAMSFGILSGAMAIVKTIQMDCRNFERDITHDTVPLVIWTFAEPVAIIISASVPVFRFLVQKPTRLEARSRLLGGTGGAGLTPSFSFLSLAGLGRPTNTWSITGGPLDTSIPLESLGGGRNSILRTDEVLVGIEENAEVSNRADNQSKLCRQR